MGLAVVFGLRTWLHHRSTGSTGFHGISGAPGSLRWWAGVLFVVALVLGVAAPAAALLGVVPTLPGTAVPTVVRGAGLVLAILGLGGVLAAQSGMGASWRIGVEDTERTDLVTGGVFALVRNPIFTAMVATQVGFALAVPNWLSLLATAALVAAVELQVRLIEEPYLLRVHGSAYRAYAARTGRFIPHLAQLRQRPSVEA